MIRSNLSISSRGISHTFRRHRGFTIVELMMSIVLVAIGTALALPSYREMVEKLQLTNGAEQLASFVNTAQGISSRTNQVVTVSYSRANHDEWCIGAVIGETACDCTVRGCRVALSSAPQGLRRRTAYAIGSRHWRWR